MCIKVGDVVQYGCLRGVFGGGGGGSMGSMVCAMEDGRCGVCWGHGGVQEASSSDAA